MKMEEKCNGYRHICGFKGKPVLEIDFTLSFSKKSNIGHFCIDCCKQYLKCHPEMREEDKKTIGIAIEVEKKLKLIEVEE